MWYFDWLPATLGLALQVSLCIDGQREALELLVVNRPQTPQGFTWLMPGPTRLPLDRSFWTRRQSRGFFGRQRLPRANSRCKHDKGCLCSYSYHGHSIKYSIDIVTLPAVGLSTGL